MMDAAYPLGFIDEDQRDALSHRTNETCAVSDDFARAVC